jgi:signal transduction histidine kinase/ActR/RegA family two-component response regulator
MVAAVMLFGVGALWEPRTAHADAPRVLVLNSYHPQYAWTEELIRGVRKELSYLPAEHLFIEFMDARRMVDDDVYLSLLVDNYAHKYRRFPPDVIISSDDSALDFLFVHRAALFPDVPIVFCGINSHTVAELEPVPNTTGILEGLEVAGNLALIERIHPDATRVVLLADRTSLGRGMVRIARQVIPRFEGEGLRIEVWDDFTLAELHDRVARVDPGTVFLLLAIHEDRAGQYFSFDEHLRPLTDASPVPIYAMFGMLLGQGVTGGAMNDPHEHGRAAAAMARRVLAGTPADAIPVVPSAEYRPRFDYARLERFDIPEDRLPAGSIVVGRPTSFYEEYARLVWAVSAVIVGLGVAVLWLASIVGRMRRAERELANKQEELRRAQRLEILGQLAGGVAHDFNNLVTAISGFALLASRRVPPNDDVLRDHLDEIQRATERAANLTRQLLSFARRQPIQTRIIDANALLLNLHKLLRRLVSEAVEIVMLPTNEPACVRIDPGQLEQVLSNLVVNARDAMPRDGKIVLGVKLTETEVLLAVSDTGVGMSEAVKARIFEPFFTTKDVGRGTGLGLATSIAIVERARGTIDVDSSPGRGTTFTIRLPRVFESPTDLAEHPRRLPVRADGGLVLLVEDDPQVRRVARDALAESGYEVLEADNGAVALELATRHDSRIRCVLTDVVMPILGGGELVRKLRSEFPDLPIVVMSGYVDDPSLGSELARLDVRFVSKPFLPDELVAVVSDAAENAPSRARRLRRA